MADVSELITLGVGTPSSIAFYVRLGLGGAVAPAPGGAPAYILPVWRGTSSLRRARPSKRRREAQKRRVELEQVPPEQVVEQVREVLAQIELPPPPPAALSLPAVSVRQVMQLQREWRVAVEKFEDDIDLLEEALIILAEARNGRREAQPRRTDEAVASRN